VDQEVLPDGRTLSDTAVGLVVEANHPVLAERAMWWPGSAGTWYEAHASAGRTESCSHWVVAEGEWRNGVETYVMVANTSDTDVALRVAALPESGAPLATSLSVPTETRRNVSVPDMFPSLLGQRFGMRLEPAPGEPPTALVVEWAVYADSGPQRWAAGASAPGTCWPAPDATP
jgi:hypothetical protein